MGGGERVASPAGLYTGQIAQPGRRATAAPRNPVPVILRGRPLVPSASSRLSRPSMSLRSQHADACRRALVLRWNLAHIGHARMMMAFDVVQRWLKASGMRVTRAQHHRHRRQDHPRARWRTASRSPLTDDDRPPCLQDIGALGIEPPTHEPARHRARAADASPDRQLEGQGPGLPGRRDGDVNYAVRKFPGYGKLSGKSLDELRAGERGGRAGRQEGSAGLRALEGRQARPSRPTPLGQSPSARAARLAHRVLGHVRATLGETFDIHGGGADLQFPHHENEIARARAPAAKPLARSGCTTVSCASTTRRCPRAWATSSPSATCWRKLRRRDGALLPRAAPLPQSAELQRRAAWTTPAGLRRLYTALVPPADGHYRLGPRPAARVQGRDGRGLRHARGRGRAVRSGRRDQPDKVAAAVRRQAAPWAACWASCSPTQRASSAGRARP